MECGKQKQGAQAAHFRIKVSTNELEGSSEVIADCMGG